MVFFKSVNMYTEEKFHSIDFITTATIIAIVNHISTARGGNKAQDEKIKRICLWPSETGR